MNKDNKHFLEDCSNNYFSIGARVYYLDTAGSICSGVVTRYRVEVDGKVLRNSNKVRRSFEEIKSIKEELQNG